MPQADDPLSRFGALAMLLGAIVLLFISAQSRQMQAQAAPRDGPVLAATPRIVMVVQTAQPQPTLVPAPTATALPPQIVVQYVEVPVYLPATVDLPPPPPIAQYRDVAVPAGAVQVWSAPVGEQPVVSSIHSSEVEMERPARLGGETSKQVTP